MDVITGLLLPKRIQCKTKLAGIVQADSVRKLPGVGEVTRLLVSGKAAASRETESYRLESDIQRKRDWKKNDRNISREENGLDEERRGGRRRLWVQRVFWQ